MVTLGVSQNGLYGTFLEGLQAALLEGCVQLLRGMHPFREAVRIQSKRSKRPLIFQVVMNFISGPIVCNRKKYVPRLL